MFASLRFRDGAITGNLAGKQLHCLVTPPSPGSAPAVGVYHIQPPVHDVVFGMVALMTPSDMGGAGTAGVAKGGASTKGQHLPAGVGAKAEAPSGVAMKFEAPGRAVTAKGALPPGAAAIAALYPPASGASSFVLSSRPIPGRNCLLIRTSFADIMDALRTAGGAAIVVA